MSNTSKINGFRPVTDGIGANWSGKVNMYAVATDEGTAIFVGDLVKLNGGGTADGTPAVSQCAASGIPVGVVVGMVPAKMDPIGGKMSTGSTTLDTPQYAAATAAVVKYIMVADDPNLIMEVQEDADTSTVAVTQLGLNFNFVVGSGSTTTGTSAMQLDSNTGNTTNTLPLKLVGFARRVDNDLADASGYKKCLVKFNAHQYVSHTGSTGV